MLKTKKKDSELQELLDEIEGKKQDVFHSREAVVPVAVLKPWKPQTDKQRAAFKEKCQEVRKLESTLEKLRKQKDSYMKVLGQITELRGVELLSGTGKVLFAAPHKFQNIVSQSCGAIDPDAIMPWARAHAPSLIQMDSIKKIDVARLEALDDVPEEVLLALIHILKFCRKKGLVEESNKEELNLEVYNEMKLKGLIPKVLLDKAETTSTNVRPRLFPLQEGKDRCKHCGVKQTKGDTCPACGQPYEA